MKKYKYLHEIPPDVLANKKSLAEWVDDSFEQQFFGLTADILHDDKLFWEFVNKLQKDPDSIFNSKDQKEFKLLANQFSIDNPDTINHNFDFNFLDELLEIMKSMQPMLDLLDKDALNSGISHQELQGLKQANIENFSLKLAHDIQNYSLTERMEYFKNILPLMIQNFDDFRSQYFTDKSKLLFTNNYDKSTSEAFKTISKDEFHNKNHWNKNCFDLFNYLIDKYEKKGKIKFINIFYFLKNHVDKNVYAFNQTNEDFTEFIFKKFSIKLITFRTAEIIFSDKEIPILKEFERDFAKQ
jgi:hypothetical protein